MTALLAAALVVAVGLLPAAWAGLDGAELAALTGVAERPRSREIGGVFVRAGG